MKGVKNTGGKNKKLLKAFSVANKVNKAAKIESEFNYNPKYAFYRFYRDSQKFNRMVLLDSKDGELKEFHKFLSELKNCKPVAIEIKNRKNRIMNNVNQLYNKYFSTYKKMYASEDLNKENKHL